MAIVDMDDPWILEYEACEKLARDIMEQLSLREREEKSSKTHDAISAKVRIRLKQYGTQVKQLNDKLSLASIISSLTAEERERRKRQVEILQSKDVQLQGRFQTRTATTYSSRSTLIGTGSKKVFADLGTTSWGDLDDDDDDDDDPIYNDPKTQTVTDLKEEQQRLLKAQDDGLDNLSKVISRQKQIASSINNEVDEQNEILVDIADNMDTVGGRIEHETSMVRIIGRKDKTWGYWLVILLLLIAIIGVSFA